MGPAFAGSVVPKAIADKAITEAIAVIEIIFMSRFPLTWMPSLNLLQFRRSNPCIQTVLIVAPPARLLMQRVDGFYRA
jgi:hypothetical protein